MITINAWKKWGQTPFFDPKWKEWDQLAITS